MNQEEGANGDEDWTAGGRGGKMGHCKKTAQVSVCSPAGMLEQSLKRLSRLAQLAAVV